jgi:hypothetical protein
MFDHPHTVPVFLAMHRLFNQTRSRSMNQLQMLQCLNHSIEALSDFLSPIPTIEYMGSIVGV